MGELTRREMLGGALSAPVFAITQSCGAADRGPPGAATGSAVKPAAVMAMPRASHTATVLLNGEVLFAGGMARNGVIHRSAERFVGGAQRFEATRAPMVVERVGHTSTLLKTGRVLIAGGWSRNNTLPSAELYDPETDRFSPTGAMAAARGDFTATLLQDGRVLVTGGDSDGAIATAEIYDPDTERFEPVATMSEGRTMHAAALLPDGRVLVAGGGEYRRPLASAEIFDPATATFAPAGKMRFPRYKHAMVALRDSRVLVVGGSDGSDWNGQYANMEVFSERGFAPASSMRKARFKLTNSVVLLDDGDVMVAGADRSVETLDPTNGDSALASGQIDVPRFYSTATALPGGRALIAGGYDRNGEATRGTWMFEA